MHKDEALKVLPHFFSRVDTRGCGGRECSLRATLLRWGASACSDAGFAPSSLPLHMKRPEGGRRSRMSHTFTRWRIEGRLGK